MKLKPIEGYNKTLGDFSDKAMPSCLDWLDLHPIAKWVTAAGLSGLALITSNILQDGE
jgi:hypothetical protein